MQLSAFRLVMEMENKPYQLEQVAIRMVEMPPLLSNEPANSPKAAVRIMVETLRGFDREAVVIVNFQNDLKPINLNFVSIGSINSSVAHPREILKSSILSNAAYLMIFHNHPSNNLTPSKEDILLTDRLQKVCTLIGIPILDHIIVGTGDEYYSFKEKQKFTIPTSDLADTIDQFKWEGNKVAEHTKYFDQKKVAEDRKNEMKEITDRLEKGVIEIYSSDKYQELLKTMAKFPRYSLNNNLLIMMQKPDATLCQSFTGWKQMGRYVKKGEKGIRILAPAPFKLEKEQDKVDTNGKPVLDSDGEPVKEKTEISISSFKPVSTFDLSQTEGEPLPQIGVEELSGNVKEYATLFEAIKAISPVPISFEKMQGNEKGYFQKKENRIAIKEGMSEVQNVKTLIHEIAHAKLHSIEAQQLKAGKQSRNSKEVEAESVAYTVCSHYGIDTSDYSFSYVATWSKGKNIPELKESLNTIRDASAELISGIDEKEKEIVSEKENVVEKQEGKKPSVRKKLKEAEGKESEKPVGKKVETKKKEEVII